MHACHFMATKLAVAYFVNYIQIEELRRHATLREKNVSQKSSRRPSQANRWQVIWEKHAMNQVK
jgi:hypothetical protein